MIIECPECGKKYKLDPEKIPEKGAKITCPACNHSFMVRKKKETETPQVKAPACVICGSPSTRVLQGDPPMLLCEACFEREKEKKRRFLPESSFETSGQKQEPEPTKTEEAGSEFEAAPESKVQSPESQDYFDSFAEIPDLGDYQTEEKQATFTGSEAMPEKPEQKIITQAKQPEMPAFDETGFETPSSETGPGPEAKSEPLEASFAPAKKTLESEEFIFSSKELSHLEETAPTEAKPEPPAPQPRVSEPSIPRTQEPLKTETELEKEIFGELTQQPERVAEKIKTFKSRRIPIKIPKKALLGLIISILVLVGGYFLFTSQAFHSFSEGFKTRLASKPEKPAEAPQVLSEEQAQLVRNHLALAEEFYKLDTKNGYLKSLAEIRSALKIDQNSNSARALEALVSAFSAYREPKWVLINKAKLLLKKAEPSLLAQPEPQMAQVLIYLIEQDYSSAQVIVNRLLENYPNLALGYWALAKIQLSGALKNYETAESNLIKALELDPKLAIARLELAELYYSKKQYQTALEQYQELVKISPERTELGAKIMEIQSILEKMRQKPEEQIAKPGLLLVPPPEPTAQTTDSTRLSPMPETSQTITSQAHPPPALKIDFDQEVKNYLLKIISQTQAPLSRVPASITPEQPTQPLPTAPERPPEEAE